MTWFREAASNPAGHLSSSRVIALVAGLSLSFSTVFLSIASFFKPELVSAVMALGPSLAGMAGAGYVTTKMNLKKEPANEPA